MAESPVTVMQEQECWDLLRSTPIGRIAIVVGNEVEIFPVNYQVQDDALYLRTAEGTKLFAVALGKPVTVEIDGWDTEQGWSVIAKCAAEQLDHDKEIAEAEKLGLQPWVPTRKNVFVKLTPTRISGRRFTFGPQPEDLWQ